MFSNSFNGLTHRGALSFLACTLLTGVGTMSCSDPSPVREKQSEPQTTGAQDRVLSVIDSQQVVLVEATEHPRAQPAFDQGIADPAMTLPALSLDFDLTPEQHADLDALLADQQNPASPGYQHWLTPDEYGARFGLSPNDLDQVTAWLEAEGFENIRVSHGRTQVLFEGAVEQVQRVFRTEIHRYDVDGERHFANSGPVSVPRALARLIAHVGGLNDFNPVPHVRPHAVPAPSGGRTESGYALGGGTNIIVPEDFATIYDLKGLYAHNPAINGAGTSVAVIGQTSLYASDVAAFRSLAGLPAIALHLYLVPGTGSATYMSSADQAEATLDVEWSSAVARNSAINFVYVGSAAYSVWNSLAYAIDSPASVGSPNVITMSYSTCETGNPSSFATSLQGEINQANAEGITVVTDSGDAGAAGCDAHGITSHTQASSGISVVLPASVPGVTGAGGTEFSEGIGRYWNTTSDAYYGSALSYIPEVAWNDTALGGGLAATGGGASIFYAKPSWQAGTGVPADGVRDVPDIALSSSWDHDSYSLCLTDVTQSPAVQYCAPGDGWASSGGRVLEMGGTSVATPTFAGLVALLNQALGKHGLGNINPALYALAKSPTLTPFHDVTAGSNIVPCAAGSRNCTAAPYQFGYSAHAGYDQVTGLGSVDGNKLWTNWPSATTTTSSAQSTTVYVPGTAATPVGSDTFTFVVNTGRIGPPLTGIVSLYDNTNRDMGSYAIPSTIGAGGVTMGTVIFGVTGIGLGSHGYYGVYSNDPVYGSSTSAQATITVVEQAVAISPTTATIARGSSYQFGASGGYGGYTWSISTNASGGKITTAGLYTAGSRAGTDRVTVTSVGTRAAATATITVH